MAAISTALPRLKRGPAARLSTSRRSLGLLVSATLSLLLLAGIEVAPAAWASELLNSATVTLEGHAASVEAITFSADGELFASADGEGLILVWDAADRFGRRLAVLDAREAGAVASLAISPDAATLAAGHLRGLVTLWNLADGTRTATLGEADHRPAALVRFSPDGRTVFASDGESTLAAWNPRTAKRTRRRRDDEDWIGPVAFSFDGALLAARDHDHRLGMWELGGGGQVRRFETPLENVRYIAVSPFGFNLATSDGGPWIRLWDVSESNEREPIASPGGSVSALAFGSAGVVLAVGGADGAVVMLNAGGGESIASIDGSDSAARLVAVAREGRAVAVVHEDEQLQLHRMQPAAEMRRPTERPRIRRFEYRADREEGAPAISPETAAPSEREPVFESAPPDEAEATSGDEPPDDEDAAESDDFHRVQVFYGTDRRTKGLLDRATWQKYFIAFFTTLRGVLWTGGVGITTLGLLILGKLTTRRCLMMLLLIPLAASADSLRRGARDLEKPGERYGAQCGDLRLGVCEVSIPRDHRLGELESPLSFFVFEAPENAARHVVLQSVDELDDSTFFTRLEQRVADSTHGEAFVFVHGFNVTFEDAARRTGQIAYDLQFDGPPILFSWPSHGSLLQYRGDEEHAAYAISDLEMFLTEIARRSGADRIHLIAHSMGNRVLTAALESMRREHMGEFDDQFREVVLAAPDIDADVFRTRIAPAILREGRRVTLYASSTDRALQSSRRYNLAPRAGEAGDLLLLIPGIDTVDVSAIDTSLVGHSYYGGNDSVISDLYYLIKEGKSPAERFRLERHERDQLPYWVFRP